MVPKGIKKITDRLHTPTWLFVLLIVVLILRIPSLFEPYSYGDEMIYLALGEAIRQRIPLYSGIHDNKPPLLYITAAVAGSLFWFRAILTVWHLATVFIFWKLTEALFPKKQKTQIVATIVFALFTTLPRFEGNIANAELFMIGPIMLAFYTLLTKKHSLKNLLISGFLFSIATMFKVPAVFDMFSIIFLWLLTNKLNIKNIKKIVINTFYLSIGLLLPIAATLIYYYLRGAFGEYLIAAYLQNVGYLSSFRPGDVEKSFITRNAPLLQRTGILVTGMTLLYWFRSKLSKQFVFVVSWLLLTLFAVTLSERPYPHYFIQSAGPISILTAIFFTQKTIEQFLVIIPLFITYFVTVHFNFWYYPTTSYYVRFAKLATGSMSQKDYLAAFDEKVPRNYEIANYIAGETKRTDKVFVWGNNSTIYALSRRLPPGKYVADYHINDFSTPAETIETLTNNPPKIIVVLKEAPSFSNLELFIQHNYGLAKTVEGSKIWRLLSPGVRSLIAP